MKLLFITAGATPYRLAFCDVLEKKIAETGGAFKTFFLTAEANKMGWKYEDFKRDYTEVLPGKVLNLPDHTTRLMYNPSITQEVMKFHPDLVLLAGSWNHPSTFLLMHSKRFAKMKIPVLFWAESHYHNGIKRKKKIWWKECMKKKMYRRFSGFCIPGKFAEEAIRACVEEPTSIIKLPNLIDQQYFSQISKDDGNRAELRKRYNLAEDSIVFFTPARLVDLKGIMPFLKSGTPVLQRKKMTWIIAGTGPLENEIREYANDNGIDIRLVGLLNQDKVRECYIVADVLLLPSLSDPNPLVVIEALWSGLPLALSCYVGNYPETVSHDNGFVFDTLSQKSVLDFLNALSQKDEEWFKKARKKSLEIAEEQFDISREAEKLVQTLEDFCVQSSGE